MQFILDKSWRRFILVAVAVLLLTAAGCGDSDTEGDDGADAPLVPPAYTLVPNFGEIGDTVSADSAADLLVDPMIKRPPMADTQAVCIVDNYAHASANVSLWNLALTITLAVPAWSFAEALKKDPVLQEDGSWIWSYSANFGGVLHTAELQGALVDGEVHWDMYITKEGFYEDFLWYSGNSDLLATAGTWTIKKSRQENVDWLGIDWSRDASNETWQVQYMNIQASDENSDGYIQYGVTLNEPYNAFYDIYYGAQGNLVQIDATTTNQEGRVRNPNHFGDDDWHYWDANHCDSEAPEL